RKEGKGEKNAKIPPPPPLPPSAAHGPWAVSRAVEQAVAGLGDGAPRLVLIFTAGETDPSEAALQASAAAAGALVAGMTGGSAIGSDGPLADGCSAIAFGAGFAVGVGLAERASDDPRDAGATAAAAALEGLAVDRGHPLLLLFLDARSGDQSEATAGAYDVAGPRVPLAGGGAAGGQAQFCGDAAHEDAVVAVALVSPQPIGLGVANGCRPCGGASIVTEADGRTLRRLDGRAATTVYLEQIGRTSAERDDFPAIAVLHPLAENEMSGGPRLRHVLGSDLDGGLRCAASVPTNAVVEFTTQTPQTIVESAGRAVADALGQLAGRTARGALVFDCAGRRQALAGEPDGLVREVDALVSALGAPASPLAGLYTRGEIARVRGAKGAQNHAVVVVTFA
ncbi:MAG: FIST signal transduction protein, partial [Solirubrobacteraceae bacterium]